MKISCVILNYNDSETTIEQLRRVRNFTCFDAIVLVDNCSTDQSATILKSYCNERIQLVVAEENGGYGAGNNIGLNYSLEVLGMTHAVIANPDTIFTDSCVKKMGYLFDKYDQVAAASVVMIDESHGRQASSWPLLCWGRDLLNTEPVCRRLFGRLCRYPTTYYDSKPAVYVDVIHGSMLMVDLVKMKIIGGYDENVFLYNEEAILGWRLKQKGYRTVQLLTNTYFHQNSASISKTFASVRKRQLLRHESAMYYYKKYLKINAMQEQITKMIHQLILLEIWFCQVVLKRTW